MTNILSVRAVLGVRSLVGANFESKWRGVAVLGGMRGALSIVLVASIPATVPGRDLIAAMAFGVAFISVMLQGPLLMRYASRNFRDMTPTGSLP